MIYLCQKSADSDISHYCTALLLLTALLTGLLLLYIVFNITDTLPSPVTAHKGHFYLEIILYILVRILTRLELPSP